MKPKIYLLFFMIAGFLLGNEAFAGNCVHGPSHCTYTSSGQFPVGGGKNEGDKINFTVNSSTRSKQVTSTVAVGCPSLWQDTTGYNCTYTQTRDRESGTNVNVCQSCTKSVTVTQYYIEHLYCPTGKELILNDKDKNLPLAINARNRSGQLSCIIKDSDAPTVEVQASENFSCTDAIAGSKLTSKCVHEWTNKDVNLSVTSIGDVGLGVKSKRYKINEGSETPITTTPFTLNFTEEGTYIVTIGVEDKSSAYRDTGSASSTGNITEVIHVINIDKHGPVLSAPPVTSTGWVDSKPVIAFKILDNYKGDVTQIKKFDCPAKPANSAWAGATNNDGQVVGTCVPSAGNNYCTSDSYFSPNQSNCDWNCDAGYTEYNGQCYVNSQIFTCNANLLPEKTYKYAVNNTIALESNDNQSYWVGPTGVGIDGNFTTYFSASNGQYSPSTSSCNYDCKNGYHIESAKCINDVKIRCCNTPYLSTSTAGARVDCSLAENAGNVQCKTSAICGQDKEVLGEWNKSASRWDYTTTNDGTKSGEAGFGEHCGFTMFANSDGETCNPGYFLEYYTNGTPEKCSAVPVGQWSGQENEKHDCTNKPANSYYTSNGTNNDCEWACIGNYTKNGNACAAGTKTTNCSAKPDNSVWNNKDKITQTWDGTTWQPSATSTYNTTSSNSECRFKCDNGFHWDGNSCEANFRAIACTNLPMNATWNDAFAIGQDWNGSSWTPSEVGTFNGQPSSTECRFVCNSGYYWDGNSCEPDTRTQNCTAKPANSEWNDVSEITQQWDGNSWEPSNVSSYNTSSSNTECRFKCSPGKSWNNGSHTCN